ncbi:uncharacterized protein LOC127102108 [Lathyrus oleraceus]|uniref:uncharacterized protein LOC127102108 n=1 Tax=Pisum sativum TaxID=3888 RepID=UPI0021D22EE1|nr:uncharacterized protein LOC127102108 [Pisum sativum]
MHDLKRLLQVKASSTLKFFVLKYGWFYYSCTKFSLKSHSPTHSYKCGCGEDVKQSILRYKVEIYVRDGDAKYGFVFWDSDCVNIIGKTVEEMRKSMLEDGEDGPMVYPDELDSLLNKKMTFRVKNAKVVSSEENVDLSACSMSACGENELDFNGDVTPIKVNSSISKDDDLDYDIVGATQYSRTKPPKKGSTMFFELSAMQLLTNTYVVPESNINSMTPSKNNDLFMDSEDSNFKGCYYDIEDPIVQCQECGASIWYRERKYNIRNAAHPKFSMCCGNGKIQLTLLKIPPKVLQDLLFGSEASESRTFQQHIRMTKSGVGVEIVSKLSEMLYENNVHAQPFWMARDILK